MVVRIERSEHEVAVACAAPTPVEVVITTLVVAVADEAVTAAAALAAEDYRTSRCEFIVDHIFPFCKFISVARVVANAAVVIEVLYEGIHHAACLSAACESVTHVDAYATSRHQCGYGTIFCRGARTVVGVGHVSPVECGVAKVHRERLA